MVGQTISHYRILSKLGSGGMGEVYEAEDVRLGRHVALKFLPERVAGDKQALSRFEREARATSQLNHPNICTIYDISTHNGLPFIVMELLEGTSLKDRLQSGPMRVDRVIEIGIQLADALEAAHSKGIIHRDIKPGNVCLTRAGPAKILDFGLAKLAPEHRIMGERVGAAGGPSEDSTMTAVDIIPGTTAYMSPEQARNDAIDSRSDLFSLGVVLYEMATGRKPFAGKNVVLTLDAILHHRPISPRKFNPNLPEGLEIVLARALEKDREIRYQTAAELREDLIQLKRELEAATTGVPVTPAPTPKTRTFKRLAGARLYVVLGAAGLLVTFAVAFGAWWLKRGRTTAPAPAAAETVAVLPFANTSGNPDIDYLRYALPDEIVRLLTYNRSVEIRPVPTGKQFASGELDPQTVGRDLGASRVITGHFMEQGGGLLVTLDLVDARRNRLAWHGTVSIPSQNLLAVQDAISTSVRTGVLPALGVSADTIATSTRPKNADAYDLYLRATAMPHDSGPNQTAITMLEHSTSLDSSYAPAWVELGRRYYYDAAYANGGDAAFDKAIAAYEKAINLDPNLVPAIANLTSMRVERGDLARAYQDALELLRRRPDSAQGHFTLSYVLRYAGLLQDAARECDTALGLDPGNYEYRSCAFTFGPWGKPARAIEYLKLDAGSEYTLNVLPSMLLRDGKTDDARKAAQRMTENPAWFPSLMLACLNPAAKQKAQQLATTQSAALLGQRDPELRYHQAAILAWCGQKKLALELLRSAIDANYCASEALAADPLLTNLRTDPQFAAVQNRARQCQERFIYATRLRAH